jgi:AraC-like DNA-binding protein
MCQNTAPARQYPDTPASTKATWLFAIHQALKNEGVDADELFESHQISLSNFKHSLTPVPKEIVNQIWQKAVQLTQNDAFGLSLIRYFNLPYLNTLASLAQASRNIEQALEVLEKFHSLVADNVAIQISCDEVLKIRIANKSASEQWLPHDVEIAFALILQYGASLPMEEIKPLRLTLTRAQPVNLSCFQQIFHCPIQFEAPEAAIFFPREALNYLIPSANAVLFTQFEKLLSDRLPKTARGDNISSLTQRTRALLKASGCQNLPNLHETAHHFCMSSSSFKKHLQVENTSYQQLADQVRREQALNLITSESRSFKEIAYLLGFANSSVFNRAFKRWTGQSPKAFRESAIKRPAPRSRV